MLVESYGVSVEIHDIHFTFYALCLLCPQIPEASIVVSPFSRENHAAFHIRNKRAQPLQRDLAQHLGYNDMVAGGDLKC